MDWDDRYTTEKIVPLITQWAVREAARGEKATLVSPSRWGLYYKHARTIYMYIYMYRVQY